MRGVLSHLGSPAELLRGAFLIEMLFLAVGVSVTHTTRLYFGHYFPTVALFRNHAQASFRSPLVFISDIQRVS